MGLRDIAAMVCYIGGLILVLLFLHQFVVQQVEVDGSSMEMTLYDKDRLAVEKLSYRFGRPKRYDIIVFRPYEEEKGTYYIKRVIGLPGEEVQITDGTIYIDGKALAEGYGNGKIEDSGIAGSLIKLGSGEYFVLGDNRNNSKDSRFSEVGKVEEKTITGRAWVRFWPLNRFRLIPHRTQ